MFFPRERSQENNSTTTHLCEALALCQSIINRYNRTGTSFSPAELKAISSLEAVLPSSVSKTGANDQAPVPSFGGGEDTSFTLVNFLEKCDNMSKDPKDIVSLINEELAKVLDATYVKTFIYIPNDGLLLDIPNGVASTVDESSALGKSREMTMSYTISNTLYIPLLAEETFVGCIEAPGARPSRQKQHTFENLIRVVSVILRNLDITQRLSWGTQKAEAMLTMATRLARDALEEKVLVQSIMNTAKQLTESDRCSMFLVKDGKTLEAHFEDGNIVTIPSSTGIAGHVATTGNIVNISNAYEDDRFNREVDKATGYHTKSILCLPVIYEGTIVAVAQLINKMDLVTESGLRIPRTFGKRDEELFETFSMFAAASLRNCRINDNLLEEKKKSDAVLDVVTLLSNTDIRDVDSIVRHVLHGAKKLLNADRSTMFLFDKERNELYSRIADSVTGSEIRFPSGQGIAGTVAASGVGENITDAYSDPRFNSAVDKQLGYRTQSILCEPIVLNGEVLAVVQLVNKIGSTGDITCFNESDRATFKIFSLFAGISINNSHLLEFAVNAGKEAMELNEMRDGVINRRASTAKIVQITDSELDDIRSIDFEDKYDFTSTTFDLFDIRENHPKPLDAAAALVYKLLLDSGLPQKFKCREETLLNFILQCRKKYRHVPYHNFFHVTDVCQTIYTFLYTGKVCEMLTEMECFVLLVTALVHDLDHMGVNNSFYIKTDSPLGILSSASGNNSVLEVHHCNLAIEILSNPASDVFEGLDPADVRSSYRALIDCVLATDMAKHVEELKSFVEVCTSGFNKEDEAHRRRIMETVIKASDVSNVTKPFEISRKWSMAVTEEFYRQGDMERKRGVEVLPMFDRSLNTELAKGQIGFIDFVAGKYFKEIVSILFHGMQWCVDGAMANRARWQEILDGKLSSSFKD